MKKKGKLIGVEGIEGSGKTTQIANIADYILRLSKFDEVLLTREPTRRSVEIRKRLGSMSSVEQNAKWFLKAFTGDRRLHVNRDINPVLERGIHVICDRYRLSTYAYQQTQGLSFEEVDRAHRGILVPDLEIIFDCPAEIAFERRKKDGATEYFDKDLAVQLKIREAYRDLHLKNLKGMLPGNIVIVGSRGLPQEVFQEAKIHLDYLLKD